MTEDADGATGDAGADDASADAADDADRGADRASVAARDDLAGIVDLFGALTREELADALAELAFKRRAEADDDAIAAAIDVAVAEYFLVPAPTGSVEPLPPDADALAVGPAAFPSLPPNAEDLPHILDVPDRTVDREPLAVAVLDRLETEVEAALGEGDEATPVGEGDEATSAEGSEADDVADGTDHDRLETLLDVAYDVEAWAPVDTVGIRERIVEALDG